MTVKDLIDLLEKANPKAELILRSSSGIAYEIKTDELFVALFDEKVKEAEQFTMRIQ